MVFTPSMVTRNGNPSPEAFRAKEAYPWLPLSYRERELYKHHLGSSGPEKLLLSMQAQFARSLEAFDYDIDVHPSWHDYARAFLGERVRDGLSDADTVTKVAELLGVTPEASPRLDRGYWRAEAVPQGHTG